MAYKRKYKSRKFRKSRRGKFSRTRRTFQSRVKRVIQKTAETKYYDIGVENQQLYHNLGFGLTGIPPTSVSAIPLLFNPWNNITQGTSRFTRIGDKITPRGMSLRIYLASKFDRPLTMFRIVVAILPKVFNGNVVSSTFDPFQVPNSGILGNTMLYPADKDKGVKFLYDKIHKFTPNGWYSLPASSAWYKEPTKCVKLWIKRKRSSSIVFDTTSSTIVNKPLAIYVIPYEQYSTLTTDNIATCAVNMRMYYKDV